MTFVSKTAGVHPIQNTSAVLISTNPVLLYGQVATETDTNRSKSGDGVSTYTQLTYSEWNYEIVEAAGTDTYTGTFSKPFFLTYFPMMRIRVRFTNANTGASTINLNGLGAKAIKKNVSSALVAGDIIAGSIHDIAYDGTNFQIANGVGSAGIVPTLAQVLAAGNTTGANDISVNDSVRNITQTDGFLYENKITFNQASGIKISSSAGALISSITIIPVRGLITSTHGSFEGLVYGADYSANYTIRSLIDKGYAAATFAPIGSGVTSVNAATGAVVLTHTTAQGVSGTWTGTALALTLGALTGVTSFNGLIVTANTGAITTGTWTATIVGTQYGGTGANNTGATVGAVPYYSSGTVQTFLAATATAGQMLRSGASAAPTWSTATFPSTATTTGAYLRADGTNWITSTLVLPNSATVNYIPYATATNTWGESSNLQYNGTQLQVGGAAAFSIITATKTGAGLQDPLYLINNQAAAADVGAQLSFSDGSGTRIATIDGAWTAAATTNGYLAFKTRKAGTLSQAMMILATGEVLIGTNAVTANNEFVNISKNQNAATLFTVNNTTSGTASYAGFSCYSSAGNGMNFAMTSATYTTAGMYIANTGIVQTGATAGMNIGTSSNTQLSFWTNNTQRASVNAGGGFVIQSGNKLWMKNTVSNTNYWSAVLVSGVLTWTDSGSATLPTT